MSRIVPRTGLRDSRSRCSMAMKCGVVVSVAVMTLAAAVSMVSADPTAVTGSVTSQNAATTRASVGASDGASSATTAPAPDAVLDRLLGPSDTRARPIAPLPRRANSGGANTSTASPGSRGSVARPVGEPAQGVTSAGVAGTGEISVVASVLQREGSFIVDRMGRLSRGNDGRTWEFSFEADGSAMSDPPVVLIPNLKLMAMEDAIAAENLDLRFRVTGMLTEYHGRNHLMLEKVVVVQSR